MEVIYMSENNTLPIPDFLDKAAENVLDEPTKAMGGSLKELWDITLGNRIHLAAMKSSAKYAFKFEQFKRELAEATNTIPIEKRTEPKLLTTGQAIDKATYSIEEDSLRNMFVNLISSSVNIDYASKIHPSFADIINQMSPVDAETLLMLDPTGTPVVKFQLNTYPDKHRTLKRNIIGPNASNDEIDLYSASLESLARHGLIDISFDNFLADESFYIPFEEGEAFSRFKKKTLSIIIRKILTMVM